MISSSRSNALFASRGSIIFHLLSLSAWLIVITLAIGYPALSVAQSESTGGAQVSADKAEKQEKGSSYDQNRVSQAPPPLSLTPPAGTASQNTQPASAARNNAPADDIPDIRDIRDPVKIRSPWEYVIYIALTVFLLILVYLIYRMIRRRKEKAEQIPKLSPYQMAMRELEATQMLMTSGRHKEFCFAVSSVIRMYIEEQFNLPAPERTTEEFLEETVEHPLLKGKLSGILAEFLQQCDLAKFARQAFGLSDMQHLYDTAHRFLLESYTKVQMLASIKERIPTKDTNDKSPPEKTVTEIKKTS